MPRRGQSQATPTSVQATNTTQQVQEGQTSLRGECSLTDPGKKVDVTKDMLTIELVFSFIFFVIQIPVCFLFLLL